MRRDTTCWGGGLTLSHTWVCMLGLIRTTRLVPHTRHGLRTPPPAPSKPSTSVTKDIAVAGLLLRGVSVYHGSMWRTVSMLSGWRGDAAVRRLGAGIGTRVLGTHPLRAPC